mgnify:CR=1 FL=1
MLKKRVVGTWSKRIVSYILIIAIVLGLIPQSALAAEKSITEKSYISDCFTITYKENSAWGNYVNADVTIKNDTDSAKSLWQIEFDFDGEVDNVWNADIISSNDGKYVFAAKTYNSTISVGQSVSFGFIAHGIDSKPSIPKNISFVDDKKNTEENVTGTSEEIESAGIELSGGGTACIKCTKDRYIVKTDTVSFDAERDGSKVHRSNLVVYFNDGDSMVLESIEKNID